jgi:CO/xanthine dehydrogenase FAD-binding subunit
VIAEAAEAIRAEVEPTTDVFESTDYKRQLAATLGRRAIAAALARAGGDGDDGR